GGIRCQDAFGVGRGAKLPSPAQALPQLEIIVDFAVVGHHGAVRRPHWLTRLVCEVDDGEPAMAKADILSRRKPEAGTVGTAMRQERRLELEPSLQVRNRAALDVHYSRDTAHWLTRLFAGKQRQAAWTTPPKKGVRPQSCVSREWRPTTRLCTARSASRRDIAS